MQSFADFDLLFEEAGSENREQLLPGELEFSDQVEWVWVCVVYVIVCVCMCIVWESVFVYMCIWRDIKKIEKWNILSLEAGLYENFTDFDHLLLWNNLFLTLYIYGRY